LTHNQVVRRYKVHEKTSVAVEPKMMEEKERRRRRRRRRRKTRRE
jgi:hypothetical protein